MCVLKWIFVFVISFGIVSCKQDKTAQQNHSEQHNVLLNKSFRKEDSLCKTHKPLNKAKMDSFSLAEIKHFIQPELQSIFEYYKQNSIEENSTWSNKLFGRCCSNTDLSFTENLFFKMNSNHQNEAYPISNISDADYETAFVFKPNTKTRIDIKLNLNASFLKGKYSNKNVLKAQDTLMNPIKLSLINGYVKSKTLFYENSRVKSLKVFVNNSYLETVILLDVPEVQEFKVEAVFTRDDTLTLEPESYYKGTKFNDVCITEIQSNLGKIARPEFNKKFNLMRLINEN